MELWQFDEMLLSKVPWQKDRVLAWHYMMCLPRKLIRKDTPKTQDVAVCLEQQTKTSQTTNIHQLGRDFETLTQQMFARTISWFVLVKWFACNFVEWGLLAVLAVYRWVKYYATLILTRLIRCIIGIWFQHILLEVVTREYWVLWKTLNTLVFISEVWKFPAWNNHDRSLPREESVGGAGKRSTRGCMSACHLIKWFDVICKILLQFQFVWCHRLDWYCIQRICNML